MSDWDGPNQPQNSPPPEQRSGCRRWVIVLLIAGVVLGALVYFAFTIPSLNDLATSISTDIGSSTDVGTEPDNQIDGQTGDSDWGGPRQSHD
ncbi:MAG: hypothetical protein AAFP68_13380 [Pseudomonadota bacterium]